MNNNLIELKNLSKEQIFDICNKFDGLELKVINLVFPISKSNKNKYAFSLDYIMYLLAYKSKEELNKYYSEIFLNEIKIYNDQIKVEYNLYTSSDDFNKAEEIKNNIYEKLFKILPNKTNQMELFI